MDGEYSLRTLGDEPPIFVQLLIPNTSTVNMSFTSIDVSSFIIKLVLIIYLYQQDTELSKQFSVL